VEKLVALVAKQVFIVKATGTNIGTVVNNSHLAFVVVFFAMLTKAIIFVQSVVEKYNFRTPNTVRSHRGYSLRKEALNSG